MLCVYGHYIYVYAYSAGIDFRRQILTSKVDPRTVRVKAALAECVVFTGLGDAVSGRGTNVIALVTVAVCRTSRILCCPREIKTTDSIHLAVS